MASFIRTAFFRSLTNGMTTLALAGALTVAPAAIGFTPIDDAAFAKGKNEDKGNRGGGRGGGNKGGDNRGGADRDGGKAGGKQGGADRADRSRGGEGVSRARVGGKKFKETQVGRALNGVFGTKKRQVVKVRPNTSRQSAPPKPNGKRASAAVDEYGLHPSDKKALNAKVAPQAIANKIAHQNWNGISGQYAQLDLLSRAATEPGNLSPEDVAALRSLGVEPENLVGPDYQEFVDTMLEGTYPDDAEFDVIETEDGMLEVACSNCDALTDPETGELYTPEQIEEFNAAAQEELDDYQAMQDATMEAERQNLDPIYDAAEDALLARTQQEVSEEEGYQWLDGVADHLGVERPQDLTDYATPVPEEQASATLE